MGHGYGGRGGSNAARVPQRLVVNIQQYRGVGLWRTKARVSGEAVTDFLWREGLWQCDDTGSGWQTYRIITDGSCDG